MPSLKTCSGGQRSERSDAWCARMLFPPGTETRAGIKALFARGACREMREGACRGIGEGAGSGGCVEGDRGGCEEGEPGGLSLIHI
eukprot:2890108-Rhodomonas_salina.2